MKTKKYIQELRENWNRISEKSEKRILEYWGENLPTDLTEEDIWIQTNRLF